MMLILKWVYGLVSMKIKTNRWKNSMVLYNARSDVKNNGFIGANEWARA
ncbi:hypothetical protein [Lederbergia lenta]|nr:hypothetical protein [Lederbergia lenta]MCM3112474.1 hypothetical protein [Lederbergia lenta]